MSKAGQIVVVVIVLAAAAGAVKIVSDRSTQNAEPISEEARLAMAVAGVAGNANWSPVVREFDGIEMVLIPSGCFQMGSNEAQLQVAQDSCDRYYGAFGCDEEFGDEQPAHEVCLSEPYWIDRTPVSNRQLRGYPGRGDLDESYIDPNFPRESVSWQQAVEICAWRGGRLPTEAEWEFAARGPDALIYPYGDEYDIELTTLRKISPPEVGQKPAAASWVGALDMAGGVSEWVADWYGAYAAEAQVNPTGPAEGELRVTRGGSWFAHAAYQVRTTVREPFPPEYASSTVGVRCVRPFIP